MLEEQAGQSCSCQNSLLIVSTGNWEIYVKPFIAKLLKDNIRESCSPINATFEQHLILKPYHGKTNGIRWNYDAMFLKSVTLT